MMGKCYTSLAIAAPIDNVWRTVRDFHDLSWARGVIDKVDVVGTRKGDQVGAQRVLNGAFHETLLELSDIDRTVKYSIDDGPPPVSRDLVRNYVGTLRLLPITATDSTFAKWSSRYETVDDQKVGEFCSPIYQALLKALQDHVSSA